MQRFSWSPPIRSPVRSGQIDVAALRRLVPTAKQDHDGFAISPKIDAIALSFVYPQLEHALTHGLPVAGKPEPQAVDLDQNPRLGSFVLELRHPPVEWDHPVRAAVLADLGHRRSVACRLQRATGYRPRAPRSSGNGRSDSARRRSAARR